MQMLEGGGSKFSNRHNQKLNKRSSINTIVRGEDIFVFFFKKKRPKWAFKAILYLFHYLLE